MLPHADDQYFRNFGLKCQVVRKNSHYVGKVESFLYRSKRYEVRITRAVRGNLSPGRLVRVPSVEIQTLNKAA